MIKDLVQKATEAIQAVVTRPPKRPESRDPWRNDLGRKAEINARAQRDDGAWIPKRPHWLG